MKKVFATAVVALSIAAQAIPVPTCPPDTQDCNIDNILQCGGAPKCAMSVNINLFDTEILHSVR